MSDAADFVHRFETWWSDPDPATLGLLLAPDIVLIQPFVAHTAGLEGARQSFSRLLEAIPDLRSTVRNWAANGDHVFIEFTLSGTLGGKPFAWDNVDRFTVGPDGLATERVNYHHSLAVAGKMLSRPGGWPRLWRSGVFRRRRRL